MHDFFHNMRFCNPSEEILYAWTSNWFCTKLSLSFNSVFHELFEVPSYIFHCSLLQNTHGGLLPLADIHIILFPINLSGGGSDTVVDMQVGCPHHTLECLGSSPGSTLESSFLLTHTFGGAVTAQAARTQVGPSIWGANQWTEALSLPISLPLSLSQIKQLFLRNLRGGQTVILEKGKLECPCPPQGHRAADEHDRAHPGTDR